MTTTELLALPDPELKKHLLNFWQLPAFEDIEFSGQFESHPTGNYGWFNQIQPIQPQQLNLPFDQGVVRSVLVLGNIDSSGEAMLQGSRYRFKVQLNRPERRRKPFDLIGRSPQLIEENAASQVVALRPSSAAELRREVEQIFQENSQGSPQALRNSARALRGVQGDMYWAVDRFVFELLQNADDLPAQPGGSVRVQVKLLPNHLVFQHDGLPFRHEHVLALANVGQSTKTADAATTGYKGIGFKSVYSKSSCVYVRSGGYSFRFASNGNDDVPWQTYPLWTEPKEYPAELRADADFFDEKIFPVCFGLQINPGDRADYAEVIRELFRDPRFALFLRSLDDIRVVGEDMDEIQLTRTRHPTTGKITFRALGQESYYLRHPYSVQIAERFKPREDTLADDDVPQPKLPDKLIGLESVTVQFAATLDASTNALLPMDLDEAVLSAYLPTEDTSYGLSLLVNADFTLTSSREKVTLNNHWNEFLFHEIGRLLIQWIADRLLEDPSRADSIYQFIPAPQKANSNQVALEAGIQQGLAEVPLIPTANGQKLVLASQAVLDEPGFYAILPDLYHGLLTDGLEVIHPAAAAGLTEEVRDRLGLSFIDQDEFHAAFSHPQLTEYYTSIQAAHLLRHLASNSATDTDAWLSATWLFDQHRTPVAPDEQHFYGVLLETPDPKFPMLESVRYLHPNIQRMLEANPAAAAWTQNELDLEPFSAESAVRNLLLPAVSNRKVDAWLRDEGVVYLHGLFFKTELQNWLTPAEQSKLSKTLVACSNGDYHVLQDCYLSRGYNPDFALEELFEELEESEFPLISTDYLHGLTSEETQPETWNAFLRWCGIQAPDAASLLRDKLVPQLGKASAWADSKHEAVLCLALDAYRDAPGGALGFKLEVLNKLKARTADWIADTPELLSNCHLPRQFNPALALLDGLIDDYLPDSRLAPDYFTTYPAEVADRFFREVGCHVWAEAQVIEQFINSSLDNIEDLYEEDNLNYTQRYQGWHSQGLLSSVILTSLRAWPLLQKDGEMSPANQCFLATEYNPKLDLEALSGGTELRFVSVAYLPAEPVGKEPDAWRKFLLGIGVKESFDIIYHDKIVRPSNVATSVSQYLDWVDDNEVYDSKYAGTRNDKKHGLLRFLQISGLEYVTSKKVAQLLADTLRAFEPRLTVHEAPIYFVNGGTVTTPAPTMLDVYPVVVCTDGVLRRASEVFSTHVKEVPTGVPVAAASYGSLKYEKVLGLRVQLTPEDALKILIQALPKEAIAGANITSTDRNKFVLRLFELQTELIGLRKPSPEWGQQLLLPAANNTWLPVANSYIISNEEYINPSSGVVLKLLPTLKQELFQQLCITLGATPVDSKDFIDEEAPSQSKDFSGDFRARVTRCKVLELIAYISGESLEQAKTWSEKLAGLRFLQVPSLRRKSLTIPDYTVPTNDNNSFADGTFLFVGSLFRGHWARLATFLIRELQLPRSVRVFLVANLLESRELGEQVEVLVAQKLGVPSWLLPIVAPKQVATSANTANPTIVAPEPVVAPDVDLAVPDNSFDAEHDFGQETTDEDRDENILDSSLSPEEQKIFHEQACKAAVEWLQAHDYILPVHIEELFSVLKPVVAPDGKSIKVVVRSALKGRLFFHVHEWAELCEPDTLLLLFCRHTGTKPFIQAVPNPAEQLVLDNPNTYVRVPNSSLNAAVLHSLATATHKHSPEFRYIFLHLPGPGAPPINLAHRRVEEVLTADTSFAI